VKLLLLQVRKHGEHPAVIGLRRWKPELHQALERRALDGTDDIERSIARVRDLGGQAEDKIAIPGLGYYAPCVDTEGNHFSLYEPGDGS
jgi:predicted enzyme related to lactoylglutathione lyase